MIDFKKPSGPLLLLLYVLLAIAVSRFIFFEPVELTAYGVSKTVGWAFNICSFVILSVVMSIIVFVLGYSILAMFKTRVNRIVSIVHTTIILITIALFLLLKFYNSCYILQVLLSVISVILFFINAGSAIRYKLTDNKRNN